MTRRAAAAASAAAAALVLAAGAQAAPPMLYVVEKSTGMIFSVDPTTGAQNSLAPSVGFQPDSIAVGADGFLYVPDYIGATVSQLYRVDRADGTTTSVQYDAAETTPQGIAQLPSGLFATTYVTDPGGAGTPYGVLTVDPDTGAAVKLTTGGPLAAPVDLTVGPDGLIYVLDTDGQVVSVDATTGTQTVVSSDAALAGLAVSIAAAPDGDLYVGTIASPAQILRVDPSTGAQSVVVSGGALDRPNGLDVGPDGTIYVADENGGSSGDGAIFRIDPANPVLETVSENGSLDDPTDVVVVEPFAAASPTSVSFGSVATGSTSAARTVTLTNSGSGPLDVSSVSLSGADAARFALSADTCTGATVAAGADCTVGVAFAPAATGAASATLTFADDAADASQAVTLAGSGAAPAPSGGGGSSSGGGESRTEAVVTLGVATAPAAPTDTITYYAVVAGDPYGSEVKLDLALPAGAHLLASYSDRGSGCAAAAPQAVECALDWIDSRHSAHVWLTVQLGGGGPWTATARVTAKQKLLPGSKTELQIVNAAAAPTAVAATASVAAAGRVTVGPARDGVRVVRVPLRVTGADRLAVSLSRLPLLRGSRVGGAVTGFWRKSLAVPVRPGRVALALRVPARLLARTKAPVLTVTVRGAGGSATRRLRVPVPR